MCRPVHGTWEQLTEHHKSDLKNVIKVMGTKTGRLCWVIWEGPA